jgi:Icc-related predicted phosphoesterase
MVQSQLRSMTRVAWATDLHLDHAMKGAGLGSFGETLLELKAEGLIVTGDLSNAGLLRTHLDFLSEKFSGWICYVLGNHDFYSGSWARTEAVVRSCSSGKRCRLNGTQVFPLGDGCALVGVDGWACGTAGKGMETNFEISDFRLIRELSHASSRATQFRLMRERAEEMSLTLEPTLKQAAETFRQVIIATHVPPWQELCRYNQGPTSPDALPFFCNCILGAMIDRVADRHPGTEFLVLCGHTHEAAEMRRGNRTGLCGPANYGDPKISRIFNISRKTGAIL